MTNHQLWLMPSAFGDSGGTGAKPPLPASAAEASASSATDALAMATMCLPKRTVRAFYERGRCSRAEQPPCGSRLDVERPFEVYLNGVQQHEGARLHRARRDARLRPAAREGARSASAAGRRWCSGIAGSYGRTTRWTSSTGRAARTRSPRSCASSRRARLTDAAEPASATSTATRASHGGNPALQGLHTCRAFSDV